MTPVFPDAIKKTHRAPISVDCDVPFLIYSYYSSYTSGFQ